MLLWTLLPKVAFILLMISSASSYAQSNFIPEPALVKINGGFEFIAPNEHYPQELKSILEQAPKGVHVSIGTERGFISVSLNPKATHLLLIDMDREVVLYNRINTLLLKISENQEDYLRMRFEMDFESLSRRILMNRHNLTRAELELLTDYSTFTWWRDLFDRYFDNFNKRSSEGMFAGANYLFEKDQFERIQKLAKEGKISSIQVNLKIESEVEQMVTNLQVRGLAISVLDISNAWHKFYMTFGEIKSLLLRTSIVTHAKSILVITDGGPGSWHYYGITFENFIGMFKLKFFIDYIKQLHTGQDRLPREYRSTINPPVAYKETSMYKLLERTQGLKARFLKTKPISCEKVFGI